MVKALGVVVVGRTLLTSGDTEMSILAGVVLVLVVLVGLVVLVKKLK